MYLGASSSSSSSCTTASAASPLHLLLESELPKHHSTHWTYAIIWQSSSSSSFFWKDGHFRRPNTPSRGGDLDPEWFFLTSFSSHGGVIANAFSSGSIIWLSGDHALRLSNCSRAHEALAHGIQTHACIPISNGVLELGSCDLIAQSWTLLHHAVSFLPQLSSEGVDVEVTSVGSEAIIRVRSEDINFPATSQIQNIMK